MRGTICMIAAIGERNRVIGRDNDLPWSKKRLLPDLEHFKALTLGKPIIMGRSTWESLPEKLRPLPGRTNIVVTRNQGVTFPGAIVAYSVCGALERAEYFLDQSEEIMVIGGAEIYGYAIHKARRLYLTLVGEDPEGDKFFPEHYADLFPHVIERTVVPDFEPNLTFLIRERA